MGSSKVRNNNKDKVVRRKEEKVEEPELPKYRDRAKERREDQNPDYEPSELGSFHAVAPPGNVDLLSAEAHRISIEKSKYLGGDVEHTHLVKGLDYALLHKVRSEIDKKPEIEDASDGKSRGSKDDHPVSFRTGNAKAVYQWIVKPHTAVKPNDMFLPGRMAFIFDMESGFSHDIPTTVYRSKADCPELEEMVTVSVDGSVLERIGKIMSYLRLGSSGKILKKKKKDKDGKGKLPAVSVDYDILKPDDVKSHTEKEFLPPPPPPPPPKRNDVDVKEKLVGPAVSRNEQDDIFVGEGTDYAIPSKDMIQSPVSDDDMEESPSQIINKEKTCYFDEPAYGPVPPSQQPSDVDWQQTNGYDDLAGAGYQGGEWQECQYSGGEQQLAYHHPEQYQHFQHDTLTYEMVMQSGSNMEAEAEADAHLMMTQEEKDRGLGSVFKRDDVRLQQLREKDAREKDPNFVSESYSECYPGYQEYNREVVGSDDDEDDLSKMDMGGRAKGRLHRWDFETEEEWATYNEQKEAMPKAAFQFGVKMQDGRKTRKQNKDQKITNELHKINKILAKKKMQKGGEAVNDDSGDDESPHPAGKKLKM
ncbi:suppressor of mec-8 and unc-52 protein homolog 2 [Rutidosis leptorrhynchoides]|uniref:suppressor of mec-8 and unc-52 protein homolog 2 n=1 Tax=Rutidosis leptorrhynchoides TaxID=125765 RepID=UPI003A99F445